MSSRGSSKRHPLSLLGLAVAVTWSFALPAMAQDDPAESPTRAGVRSSPFDPPSDDVFVADSGPGLDTGCTFNTDPEHPLVIDVLVDVAVGEIDAGGHLLDPAALVADGVVPATVEIIMPAFDVDVNGTPPPERDEVLFNGSLLGTLTGGNGIWKLNSFRVGISELKFPDPDTPGATASNRVQINVDTLSSGRWCTALDWVALVVPVELQTAFTITPGWSNGVADNDGNAIEVIYEQSFDADCQVSTEIGPYDAYPFSGPGSLFFFLPGYASLDIELATCPSNPQLAPEVKVDWRIAGTSLEGVETWTGSSGAVLMRMPDKIGVYDVELEITVDSTTYPTINRKLFVTESVPTGAVGSPRIHWYELATGWASGLQAGGLSSAGPILQALLDGIYGYGQANWRYGYYFGGVLRCSWQQLADESLVCNYSDCHIFSEVLENMAGTLGVGGLGKIVTYGNNNSGFLTSGSPSLDPLFTGNAKEIGTTSYDRYRFANHSLRLKGGTYYDATFRGTYPGRHDFITAHLTGNQGSDADGTYLETDEGWKIYELGGSVYDGWGKNDYKRPGAPSGGWRLAGNLAGGVSFPGGAAFTLLDEDGDGVVETLEAEVDVELEAAGEYTIRGELAKDGNAVADLPFWESMLPSAAFLDEISGTYTVTLRFSGEQVFRSGEDGPYSLEVIAIGEAGRATASFATPAYDHADFGEVDARLLDVAEAAVDADGNGSFDFIEAMVELDVRLEGDFRLQADLSKNGQSIAADGVDVSLESASQVSLRFDGEAIRRAGLDGPYDGVVSLIDAAGSTLESLTFTTGPYTADSFSAFFSRQGPSTAGGVDSDGNGRFESLRVEFTAAFREAGTYLLTAILRGPGSEATLGTTVEVVAAGSAALPVRLEFAGPSIFEAGLDGPYMIDVVARTPTSRESLGALSLDETAAFMHTDFESQDAPGGPIQLTGLSSDHGVDTDGNGLFDELRVDIGISFENADSYEWSARLEDAGGGEIGFFTSTGFFNAGVSDLPLTFDGLAIGDNGVDGPYAVKGLLVFGSGGDNLVSVEAVDTSGYGFIEFERTDLTPPQITIEIPDGGRGTGANVLRLPHHKLSPFDVSDFIGAVSDDFDATLTAEDVVITSVTSDEPDDAPGPADGTFPDDIQIAQDCRSVGLRAERDENGNGRVYTLHLGVADAAGNVASSSLQVLVPPGRFGTTAVDDGPMHGVAGCSP